MTEQTPETKLPVFKGTFEVTCKEAITQQHVGMLGDLMQKLFTSFEFSQITIGESSISVKMDNRAKDADMDILRLMDVIEFRSRSFEIVRFPEWFTVTQSDDVFEKNNATGVNNI